MAIGQGYMQDVHLSYRVNCPSFGLHFEGWVDYKYMNVSHVYRW